LCSEKDYYVAVGEVALGDTGEMAPDVELPGQPGVNRFSYFVTNDLSEEWTALPIVKP